MSNLQDDHKDGLHKWPHEECYSCQLQKMSTTDFKDHIRRLCGVPEGAGRKAHPCVVRENHQ